MKSGRCTEICNNEPNKTFSFSLGRYGKFSKNYFAQISIHTVDDRPIRLTIKLGIRNTNIFKNRLRVIVKITSRTVTSIIEYCNKHRNTARNLNRQELLKKKR